MALFKKIWPLMCLFGCYDLDYDPSTQLESCPGIYVCAPDGVSAQCVAHPSSATSCAAEDIVCDKMPNVSEVCTNTTNNGTNNGATALLQVIHNSADPAAATIDVYVNGDMFLDDFDFRNASPFEIVPAGTDLEIEIAPSDSTSADDAIKTFGPYNLAADSTTVLIASGVVDPTAFDPNPDAESTALNLYAIEDAKTTSTTGAIVAVFHGVTDAPTIDVILNNNPALKPVDDAKYGDTTPYAEFPEGGAVLDVTNADNTARIASFGAAVPPGVAVVVVASGFANPAQNAAAPLGLFAFFSTGGAGIPLPSASRLQVIHNSADPAAAQVDVYIDDKKAFDDFTFRTATPFFTLPAGDRKISIAPSTSASVADAISNTTVTLEGKKSYLAVANGVITPADFAVNPDAKPTALTVTSAEARERATDPAKVEIVAVHGGTDAPTVDLRTSNNTTLFSDLSFGDISDYTALDPASMPLNLRLGNNSSYGPFTFDAAALGGRAVTIVASGFAVPADNANGIDLGLVAYTAAGGTAIILPPANL